MSVAVDLQKTYTIEEFMRLDDNPELRYGLIEGRLIEMSPAGDEHGRISGKLFARLYVHIEQHKLGLLYPQDTIFELTPPDPTLSRAKKRGRPKGTGLAPDIGFVRAERVRPVTKGAVPIPPDLVVEVISPSDKANWLNFKEIVNLKIAHYQLAGVSLVWAIDPERRLVEVYRGTDPNPRFVTMNEELDGEDVIPGFRLPVSELFDYLGQEKSV